MTKFNQSEQIQGFLWKRNAYLEKKITCSTKSDNKNDRF